jgi:hypothetical protein
MPEGGALCLCICVKHDHAYAPLVVSTSRSIPHSWIITWFLSRLTQRVSLVEQELLTFPEHLSSPSVLNDVRVTRSLVWCVCFVDRRLSFCLFSFGHLLSVLRFTDSDYPYGIFKLDLQLSSRSLITQYLLKLLAVHVTSLVSSNFSYRLHILLSCFTCVVLYLRIGICCVPSCWLDVCVSLCLFCLLLSGLFCSVYLHWFFLSFLNIMLNK